MFATVFSYSFTFLLSSFTHTHTVAPPPCVCVSHILFSYIFSHLRSFFLTQTLNLNILQRFTEYSKLEININKFHTLSYISDHSLTHRRHTHDTKALRIKNFNEMFNSKCYITKELMKKFVYSERRTRRIEIRILGVNSNANEDRFLNWKITNNELGRGTNTVIIKAFKAAKYFKGNIILIDDLAALEINTSHTHIFSFTRLRLSAHSSRRKHA